MHNFSTVYITRAKKLFVFLLFREECLSADLPKAGSAENLQAVLSCPIKKKWFSLNLLRVLRKKHQFVS